MHTRALNRRQDAPGGSRAVGGCLTPSQAFAVAAQFGSYVRSPAEPDACFYAFRYQDGRPVSEGHRRALLDRIGDKLRKREAATYRGAETERRELRRLRRFLTACPIHPLALES